MRDSPEALGQRMDGEPASKDDRAQHAAAFPGRGASWSAGDILRSRDFWLLALGVGIVFGGSGGWNANVPRYGEDLGYSGEHMAALIGLAGGLGAPATLLFGGLADRFDNRRLLALAIGGQALALGALWTAPPDALFTAAILLFGFTGGALMPVYASLIGRLFGPLSFGSVMGLGGLVMLPFGAGAPIAAGAMRDLSGSYTSALLGFTAAFGLSAVLLLLVRRPAAASA
jgi:MFS family permease